MENKKERVFENTYRVDVKSKKIRSLMKVTANEHVHDSKAPTELVESFYR